MQNIKMAHHFIQGVILIKGSSGLIGSKSCLTTCILTSLTGYVYDQNLIG